jgi:hypothetical protein
MKTYGLDSWIEYPSYLDIFVPYILDIFDELKLKATFFLVGQDVILEKNQNIIRKIVSCGHEVGNHTFSHEPWLNLYEKKEIEREILKTDDNIFRVTGVKPVGFRGPGFSWTKDLFKVLVENGYIYDATTLPTFIGPLARAFYFRDQHLSESEKEKRKHILGGFGDCTRPVKPYLWKLTNGSKLLEIPVTTIPLIKVPFHMSYLLVLARASKIIMKLYLKMALLMCRLTKVEPSFLVHPLDLLGGDQIPELNFFPGMNINSKHKLAFFTSTLKELTKHYNLGTLRSHADSIFQGNNLDQKEV